MKYVLFLLGLLLAAMGAWSQDYHAIAGSNYAGSLGVHNNPASAVNTPYSWDVTLVGLQAKYQTNAIKVVDYGLLTSPLQSRFFVSSGNFARHGNEQLNLNLLNTRFALNRRTTLAFGANVRSFATVNSSPYNYIDTIQTFQDFFLLNPLDIEVEARVRTSNWIELYGSIGKTIIDQPQYRLNAGATLKVNRGIAGGRAELMGVEREQRTIGGRPDFLVTEGQIAYGYSSNFDRWQSGKNNTDNIREFLTTTQMGLSADFGLELILKPSGIATYVEDEESYYDYDWKFGASLLDLGYASYRYSSNSVAGAVPAAGISSARLNNAFLEGIENVDAFRDSMAALLDTRNLRGLFRIWTPARIVLNADRYISGGFYVNAELNINLVNLLGEQRLYNNNLNRLRITPRWETRRWGVYMPFLLNSRNQFWVGGAVKAGPLLFGFHNLANVFGKQSMARGGGYVGITIRPGKSVTKGERFKGTDCVSF